MRKMAQDGTETVVLLKREMGLSGGVALIVGSIIGTGIFVTPGTLLSKAGSVSTGLVVWAACGLLSLLGALAYAELGTIFPRNGGEYAYFSEGLKDLHPFFAPLPGFIFIWVNTCLLMPSNFAIGALIFAQYILEPIWDNLVDIDMTTEKGKDTEKWVTILLAAVCVCGITLINCFNVKLAARVQIVFTLAKVGSILLLIIPGIVMVAKGESQVDLKPDFEQTSGFAQLAGAFYSGFYAYGGWNQLNFVMEELKNPYVNLPRAIVAAMSICIICYLLINIAFLTVLTAEEIISSSAVAVDFGERVLGKKFSWVMPLLVAVSTFGATNGGAFAAGRIPYSAAKNGQMPEFMGYVNIKSSAPTPSLIFQGMFAIVLILVGDVGRLIDVVSFTTWIFYGGAMCVLIFTRWRYKDLQRPYKTNIAIPIFVAILSVYLVVGPIVDNPQVEYLYAIGFISAGLLVYVPLIYYKLPVPGTGQLNQFIKKWMSVAPTAESPSILT